MNTNNTLSSFILSLVLFLLVSIQLQGQEGLFLAGNEKQIQDTSLLPTQFHLFDTMAPLKMTIKSDFKKLSRQRRKENYQPALLIYPLNDSVDIHQKVEIRPRGNTRQKLCSFPPIKVDFEVSALNKDYLKDLNELKMVVECKSGNLFRQLLFKEYLVYRMYNMVTDKSFKVRLLKISYIDTGRKNKQLDGFAFFIERPKEMAARLNGAILENQNLQQRSANHEHETKLAFFQYMIGNTDYYVPVSHNVKILKVMEFTEPRPYLIPYDFDYSGIVDAPYAVPHEDLGIKNVRQRIYRGYCREDEMIEDQITYFESKKVDFYQLIREFDLLDERHKREMLEYLDSFYQELKDPEKLKINIRGNCLN